MKGLFTTVSISLILLLSLTNCNTASPEIPTPVQSVDSQTETSTEVEQPNTDLAHPETAEVVDIEADRTTTSPQKSSPVLPLSPTANNAIEISMANQPPTLFETMAWADRTPFAANLLVDQQSLLDGLSGASIYHLKIMLSDSLSQLTGHMEVHYTNMEDIPLDEIIFRLFPNLFGGQGTVSMVMVNSQIVEPKYSLQDSVLAVPLANPLLPGNSVVVGLEFAVNVPTEITTNYGVQAYVDEVLAGAHLYPMIPVYDDEGWNVEIPPPAGDVVYTDASFYLVEISYPHNVVLAASGTAINREKSDSRHIVTYALGPARDFYFAASEKYEVQSQTVGGITINSYALPTHQIASKMLLTQTEQALHHFEQRFGPYPYNEFDIVSTPTYALGIEYPGIVVMAQTLYNEGETVNNIPVSALLESTIAHEVAHQWFYNIVGSDQLDEPWLDEALTQYATWLYFVDSYGYDNADAFFDSFEGRWNRVNKEAIPIGLPVSAYEGQAYSAIIYGRGPLVVKALEDEMGQAEFEGFLKKYYQTYQWGIASTDSLKTLAERHCHCNLTPIFTEAVYQR